MIIRSDVGEQRHAVTSVGAHIDVDLRDSANPHSPSRQVTFIDGRE